jgi:hypothetical protein
VRVIGATAALVAVHELVVGGTALALLAVGAVGTGIVVAAIARTIAGATSENAITGWKRELIVVACGLPLVIAAFATGAVIVAPDPGYTPRALVADLVDDQPSGPGVFVAMRAPSWFALQYERTIAGLRPDLELVPPLPGQRADVIVADALRAGTNVGADSAAFGRLDVQRSIPRGRGFQLLAQPADVVIPVEPFPHYAPGVGAGESLILALERARLEAAAGRLDAAARAAGLTTRFGAADLAVLALTVPTHERPPLFGFLPLDAAARGPWLADVFGDDLAWLAALPQPEPPADAPMPRRLHALWRQMIAGTLAPDAPAIAALGPDAVEATKELRAWLAPSSGPPNEPAGSAAALPHSAAPATSPAEKKTAR